MYAIGEIFTEHACMRMRYACEIILSDEIKTALTFHNFNYFSFKL